MLDPGSTEALITIDKAGHYVDANDAALELLGVTLSELRTSAPDRFAIRPTVEAEQAELRDQWETGGEQPLVGTAGIRRADGTTIRISYAIEATDTGFRARMQRVDGSPEAPPSLFTVGRVLSEWRAAERVLAELPPDSPEWARIQEEVEMLRGRYHQLFKVAGTGSGGA
jgi:PAS domain S-box-containing protein